MVLSLYGWMNYKKEISLYNNDKDLWLKAAKQARGKGPSKKTYKHKTIHDKGVSAWNKWNDTKPTNQE